MKLLSVHKSPRHSKEVVKDVDKSLEHNVTPTARVKGFLSMVSVTAVIVVVVVVVRMLHC